MNAVSSWIMSILGIVVIGTLLDMVLPAGRMSKFLKSVFSALTVLVIVTPLPGFFKGGFKFDSSQLFKTEFTLDSEYIAAADKIKLNYMAYGLEKQLESDGYKGADVEITGYFDKSGAVLESVKINISNIVIDSDNQHINKNEYIRNAAADYLKVEKGIVTVYG